MNDFTASLDGADVGLPLSVARQVNRLCDEFERTFAAGNAAELARFLDQVDPAGRTALLTELLGISLERLRAEGIAGAGQVIADRNPALRAEIEAALARLSEHEETLQFEPATDRRRDASTPRPSPLHHSPRRKKSRGLHIRCPHCSNHVEVVGDTPLDSVNCNVCGSAFSLIDRSKETKLAATLERIDRFELVSRLGVGGFGTVWKARDTELDRVVALKIPRHGQLSPAEMEQFFREARSVAQLRHPNIVPVHEVGREGDTVFIVSDLVRGVSLSDRLTGTALSPREAADVTRKIAAALDHAHSRGVIHRDLKPSNVMIDDDGEPHLMDFGLAKREAEEVTMTVDGQIIGTPAYMSPEQAGGKSAWADRRADVYSLGVILFELLTGELPFRGNAQMQVHQRLINDAPNARSLNRHIPLDLATICAKCLEREPGGRYQTAKHVVDELQRFLDRLPIKARPLSRLQRAVRWARRKPLAATVAGLVGFLAIAGPTAALVIERHRARLDGLVAERDNLIKKGNQDAQQATERATRLQQRLDVWEGRTNPWTFWPPQQSQPPHRTQLHSLDAARRPALEASAADPDASALARAHSLLALAALDVASEQTSAAADRLRAAVPVIEGLREDQAQSSQIGVALADVYDRLSQLTASDRDASIAWLKKARELSEQLAKDSPDDASLHTLWLQSELRLGAASGFRSATDQLATAEQLSKRLPELWPTTPTELYELVCRLSGQPALLRDE